MKKVTFGGKPAPRPETTSPDEWVADRAISTALPPEPIKRLTFDVTPKLHKRIKSGCANEGLHMADVMRELLENRFPEE